ncbi:Nif3-like dinuclear metal center protein, partial [Vibrio parahaemolyticus]|nr:Nif3-like dinuclear metal center protein [Vibrio parahaemolyticus]NMS02444.1 Nif3-like dinuclear metal center protein [Vibrio parahaemolyticus]
MNTLKLEQILNDKLSPQLIKDYAPNGLQVEGKSAVKRVITG